MSHGRLSPEITAPVPLCLPTGRLNPAAIGHSRAVFHDTSGLGEKRAPWGRDRCWEHWSIVTPEYVCVVVTSTVDYGARHRLWLYDRAKNSVIDASATLPFRGHTRLPANGGSGPIRARTAALEILLDEVPGGTRLRALTSRIALDLFISRPDTHEVISSVTPWGPARFAYLLSDLCRPVSGAIRVDGSETVVSAAESLAMLDHGRTRRSRGEQRGRGGASGMVHGRALGIRFGGQDALVRDDRVTFLATAPEWSEDSDGRLRVRGSGVDLSFTPLVKRVSRGTPDPLGGRNNQYFGYYDGLLHAPDGSPEEVTKLLGWAGFPGR